MWATQVVAGLRRAGQGRAGWAGLGQYRELMVLVFVLVLVLQEAAEDVCGSSGTSSQIEDELNPA